MIYVLLLIESCLVVAAQLVLRYGAARLGVHELSLGLLLEPLRNPYIFFGLVLHGLSFFLYIFLLSRLNLNVVYPVSTGATIVLIALISTALLSETMSPVQAIGILTIVVGIGLVFFPA
jgi:multidrug transporter EmrE-like cation transporter